MTLIQSIFLGIVQGVTEFLPVSSSGHLAILKNLLGIEISGGLMFDVLMHFGTLIAICVAFRKDLVRMFAEILRMTADMIANIKIMIKNKKEKDAIRYKKVIHNNYSRLVAMILWSMIPTGIIGYAARDLVEMALQTLLVPGICLMLTAVLLLIADLSETGHKVPKDVTFTNAFMVGIAQGVSTLPGLSRSGVTISVCLLSGFDRRFAVKYSFIMAIPAIIGAMILELTNIGASKITISQFGIYLTGAVIAGIVGYFCIKKMLLIVRKKRFKGFALYCLLAGILSISGYIAMR